MKRSEMLQLMVKVYAERCSTGDTFYDMDELGADKLLSALEDAGMLPPEHDQKSVLPGIADFKVNKWEPEDV